MGALEMPSGVEMVDEVAGTSGRGWATEPFRVFAWGVGEDGQLGQGTLDDEHWPTQVAALDQLCVEQLVAGSRNSLAITEQGRVYTWGWNQRGTLGFAGENKTESEAHELTGLAGRRIVQAAIGGWHCLAVDESGQTYCWGGNEYGQCGLPVEKLYVGGRFVKKDITPPRPCAPSVKVRTVSAGGMHSLLLTTGGEVWTWGQPLVATGAFDNWKPHQVAGLPRAAMAVAGAFHNLVLSESGEVLAWGNGLHGQLGQGDTHNRATPSVVQGLKGLRVRQLAAGGWHSAALTEDGQLYVWGRGEHGRLGLGTDNKDKLQPTLVEPLAGEHIVHVSCGGSHSAAVTKDGRLFLMGRGEFGRLGCGTTKTSNRPVLVSLAPGLKGANNPGSRHVSFSRVVFDGTNSDSESETPGKASGEEEQFADGHDDGKGSWGVVMVSCGGRHTLALAHPGGLKSGLEKIREEGSRAGKLGAAEGDCEHSGADTKEEQSILADEQPVSSLSSSASASVGDGSVQAAEGSRRCESTRSEGAARSASLPPLVLQDISNAEPGANVSNPAAVPSGRSCGNADGPDMERAEPSNRAHERRAETSAPLPSVPSRAHRHSPKPSYLSEDEDGDHELDDVSSIGSQPGDRSSPLSILEAHDVPGCLEAWAHNRQRGEWPEEVEIKGKQLKEDLRLAGITPEEMSDGG